MSHVGHSDFPGKDDSLDEVQCAFGYDTVNCLPRGKRSREESAGVELFNVLIILTLVTIESFILGRSYTWSTWRPST